MLRECVPEFSRIVVVNSKILNRSFEVFAEKFELERLAERFEVCGIDFFSVRYLISEKSDIPEGFVCATNIQSKVTKFVIEGSKETLEIDENFDVVFLSEKLAKEHEEQLKEYDIEI